MIKEQTSDFEPGCSHSYFEAFPRLAALADFPTLTKDALYLKSYFVIHCGTSYLRTELQLQKERREMSPVTGLCALPASFQTLLLALMIRAAQHCVFFAFNHINKLLIIGAQIIFLCSFFFFFLHRLWECLDVWQNVTQEFF